MVEQVRTLWPVHLKPRHDELLSSWLVRLAIAHGLRPDVFTLLVLPEKLRLPVRVDETRDDEFLSFLVMKTGTGMDEVQATTLAEYERYFAQYDRRRPPCPQLMSHQWVMPVNHYKRILPLFGLQFCPYCLSEDETSYFRRRWRLAFVTLCERHQILLLDRCERCGSPINFQKSSCKRRGGALASSMTKCYSCNFNLKSITTSSSLSAVTREQIEFQQLLIRAVSEDWDTRIEFQQLLIKVVSEDWNTRLEGQPLYLFHYFQTLHKLMRVLAFGKLGEFLRKRVSARYKLSTFPVSQEEPYRCIETLEVSERLKLLETAKHLIMEWPDDLLSISA